MDISIQEPNERRKGGSAMVWDISPREPLKGLERMRRDMDRLWDSFQDERPRRGAEEGEWFPSLDVSETKSDVVVKAELPGVDSKDIDFSLADGVMF
jgi:HSP20 family protein